jgi:hypothetical protein
MAQSGVYLFCHPDALFKYLYDIWTDYTIAAPKHATHIRFGCTFQPLRVHHPIPWNPELCLVDSLVFK